MDIMDLFSFEAYNLNNCIIQIFSGYYKSTIDINLSVRDIYTAEFVVRDVTMASSLIKPLIVFCDCEEAEECNYDLPIYPSASELTFAYATCECPAGMTGDFCEADLDGCVFRACYGGLCLLSPLNKFVWGYMICSLSFRRTFKCIKCMLLTYFLETLLLVLSHLLFG